jgi:ribose 5-phosphate isomerase B
MRIAIGSDHFRFDFKERLKAFLAEAGHEIEDFGPDSASDTSDVLVIRALAQAVASQNVDRGILLGSSGHRETIIANRTPRVRCTLCWDVPSALSARHHAGANLLALGCHCLDFDQAREITECWLETPLPRTHRPHEIRAAGRAGVATLARRRHRLPHRVSLTDEASFICESCGQEFQFPIDLTGGSLQQVVEECPICCHENSLSVEIDEEGTVRISGDPDQMH